MLRLNLVSVHEVTQELLDSLPAVLRLQVDHIHVWPEVVIRKLAAKTSRGLLGWSRRTTSRCRLRLRILVWLRITHRARSWLTLGLSGAGPKALKCKQDAPSRIHSRPLVGPRFHNLNLPVSIHRVSAASKANAAWPAK